VQRAQQTKETCFKVPGTTATRKNRYPSEKEKNNCPKKARKRIRWRPVMGRNTTWAGKKPGRTEKSGGKGRGSGVAITRTRKNVLLKRNKDPGCQGKKGKKCVEKDNGISTGQNTKSWVRVKGGEEMGQRAQAGSMSKRGEQWVTNAGSIATKET